MIFEAHEDVNVLPVVLHVSLVCLSLLLLLLLLHILNNLPQTLGTLLQLLTLLLTQLQRNAPHDTLSAHHHRHRETHIHIILVMTDGSNVTLIKQNRLANGSSNATDTVGSGAFVFHDGGRFLFGVFGDGVLVNGGVGKCL